VVERSPDIPPERIPTDVHLAVAEATEQIEELGHAVTQLHVESYNRDHYIVNLELTTVEGPIGSPEYAQERLKGITEESTKHADKLVVSVQEGPDVTAEAVLWELEAIIRVDPEESNW
jgi:predicted signal transduction protein with EAL and GGDEF domain